MAEALRYATFEVYLEAEQRSEQRHELVAGRRYTVAGASARHGLLSGRLFEVLAPGARARRCRPFSSRLLRTVCGNAYYPDVMVACGSAAHDLYETDATLTIEVLSPSTQGYDRREKAVAYAESPHLQLLLLVDQSVRRIEVARPAGGRIREWRAFGPGEVIFTPYGDINVDACYGAVDRLVPPG